MTKQRGSPIVGSAQDVGGAEDGVQREQVRTGAIQTADGKRILLSVVAVGTDSGEAAARVVEQVFQAVAGAQAANVGAALKRGLEIASQGLVRKGQEVAAAAVAIRRSRVYFANIGNNHIFRVAGQEVIRLTQPSNRRLGAAEAPTIQAGPSSGLALQSGDRVVITSAGLLESSPADGKPFVDPQAIPGHIKNLPPEDAAKHLVSIALGRDVGSNVTVAVLGEAKDKPRLTVAALAVAGTIGALLLIVAAITLLGSPDPNSQTDFGFAVLVRGGVLSDNGDGVPALLGNLDTIAASAVLSAQTDAVLGLQSTYEGNGEQPGANIYLGQGVILTLTEIDLRTKVGGSNPTRLDLGQGSILVSRRSGTWEYQVHYEMSISILSGAGPGVMGVVSANGGGPQLFCLAGNCRFETAEGDEMLLNSGEKVLLRGSTGLIEQSSIAPAVVQQWDRLCGGCLGAEQ